MTDLIKNRIKIVMNYKEYPRGIADSIAVLLMQNGYRLACTDLSNSDKERIFYFSKEN